MKAFENEKVAEVAVCVSLGSCNTVIEVEGHRITRPTEIMVHHGQVFSVGQKIVYSRYLQSHSMSRVVYPMRHGIVAEFDEMKALLFHFMSESMNALPLDRKRLPIKAVVAVPMGITSAEQDLIVESLRLAGAHQVVLVQNLDAVLIGSSYIDSGDKNCVLVDFGGSTTELATVSNRKIVFSCSVRVGGECFVEEIEGYLRSEYGVRVGGRSLEKMRDVGVAAPDAESDELWVRSSDLITGVPRSISLQPQEIQKQLENVLEKVAEMLEQMLSKPQKIVFTGGASQLKGLGDWFTRRLNAPVFIENRPLETAIDGLK